MKRLSVFFVVLMVLTTGCRAGATSAASGPSGRATVPASTSVSPSPTGAGTPPALTADDGPPGLLAAIRTEHFADHDRVTFQFHGRQLPTPVIRYRDRITADPSDGPVPLAGKAFVRIAFHGARLDTAPTETDPAKARRYTGPTRLTPGYPVLAELAVAGDFEGVLSFGLGLSAVAGLSRPTPPNPASLVLDLWRTAPGTMLWPVTTIAQARQVQDATRDGHQPWTLVAQEVATQYTQSVLGWQATVRRLGPQVFEADTGSEVATITLSQPLGGAATIWTVASVVRT